MVLFTAPGRLSPRAALLNHNCVRTADASERKLDTAAAHLACRCRSLKPAKTLTRDEEGRGARTVHTHLHTAVARCVVMVRPVLPPLNSSHVALRSAGACPLSTGWRHEPSDKWHRATRSERATGIGTEVCVGTCCHAPLRPFPTSLPPDGVPHPRRPPPQRNSAPQPWRGRDGANAAPLPSSNT